MEKFHNLSILMQEPVRKYDMKITYLHKKNQFVV